MCPEKKVDWFDKNSDWRPEDKLEVRKIVHKRWAESYGASLSTETMATSWDGWSAKGEPTFVKFARTTNLAQRQTK